MEEKLKITKISHRKGEDGHHTFSIRIPEELSKKLEKIVVDTGRSRNDVIKQLLEYAVKKVEVEEEIVREKHRD